MPASATCGGPSAPVANARLCRGSSDRSCRGALDRYGAARTELPGTWAGLILKQMHLELALEDRDDVEGWSAWADEQLRRSDGVC